MHAIDLDSLGPKPISQVKRAPEGMRNFTITRLHDESGVSGTGEIAQGVEFATGDTIVQWLSGPAPGDIVTKSSLDEWIKVHASSHPKNITLITYDDGTTTIIPSYISMKDVRSKTIEELHTIVADHTGSDSE